MICFCRTIEFSTLSAFPILAEAHLKLLCDDPTLGVFTRPIEACQINTECVAYQENTQKRNSFLVQRFSGREEVPYRFDWTIHFIIWWFLFQTFKVVQITLIMRRKQICQQRILTSAWFYWTLQSQWMKRLSTIDDCAILSFEWVNWTIVKVQYRRI